MKKNFTLLLSLIIITITATAQPTIQWQKLLGGTGNDQFTNFKTQQTSDGGYIVVGNTIEAGGAPGPGTGTLTGLTNNGYFDGWVVKLDASGNTTWQKLLGGNAEDRLFGAQQTADGGYIVIGYSNSSNSGTLTGITGNGGLDGWIVKLDANGNTTWQKLFGGNSEDYFFGISQSSDGGYIVTGQANSSNSGTLTGITNNGGIDGWVIKMDATGTIIWQKLLGGNSVDAFREVRQTTDGGYVTAGISTSSNTGTLTGVINNGAEDGWIVKLDAAGNTTWQKLLGGDGTDYLTPIQQTSEGGYITALASKSSSNTGTLTGLTNHGDFDGWVIKLDASGNTTWQKLLGGDNDDEFYGCRQTNDGGYVLAGYSSSSNTGTLTGFTNHGNYDGWFVILDAAGNTRTQQLLGGIGDDRFYTLGLASDGYILEGYSATPDRSGTFTDIAFNGGAFDGWALKLLKLATTTSITSSLNPSIAGQSITFTATVSTAAGTPTGTVTFFDGTTNIGTGTLSGDTATLTTTALAAGPHNISASYDSDALYGVSTSAVLSQVVKTSTLPITFLKFDGLLRNHEVLLNWSTANEINNKGFDVQKSADGQTFASIGFVDGNPNSTNLNNYSFTDTKVISGLNYYRLKQFDLDGKFTYSSVIKINYSKFDWVISGNPASGNIWVQLQLDKKATVSLQVISINGQVISTVSKGYISEGTYSIPINLTKASEGVYAVRLLVNGMIRSKKIVK